MKALKTLLIGAALAAALASCKKEDETPVAAAPTPEVAPPPAAAPAPAPAPAEMSVSGVVFGTAVGADKNVVTPSTSFGAKDTIYAAVTTQNTTPGATLEAKWSGSDGKIVHDDTVTIASAGDSVTDFQLSSPTGFAPGKYQVEIFLNGKSVNAMGFDIH